MLQTAHVLDQRLLIQHMEDCADQKHLKATYAMDAYFAVLGQPTDHWQVKKIAYWYSLWSHRSDRSPKYSRQPPKTC